MTKEEWLSKMKADPLLFGKLTMPKMFREASPPFHYELVEAYLDKKVDRLCVIAPRGHAKSSVFGCLLVLHHLFFDEGEKFVVLCSKTQGHADRLLETIKDVLDYSVTFRAFFGYHGMHNAKSWTKSEVVLDTGAMILTRGTGQMVVGLKHGNQRPTFILLDDPEDLNNTKTPEAMEMNLRWLLTQLIPTRDAHKGRIFVIGTPQHQRCMVETLKGMAGWKNFWYSAEKDPQTKTALWPEQWSWEKLMKERESAESINRLSTYLREYCCSIISDETQLFREEYIQYYDGHVETHAHGENVLVLTSLNGQAVSDRRAVNVFMGIDPATSVNANADFTVIMPVAIDSQKNVFVMPYVRKRMPPSETIQTIVAENRKWKPRRVSIETTAAQETFRDILSRLDGEFIPGMHMKHHPREKKDKRYLEVLEPYFSKRKVYIMPTMRELKDELLMFGPTAKHDDQLDAMYYALRGIYPPSHAVTTRKEGQSGEDEVVTTKSWQTA